MQSGDKKRGEWRERCTRPKMRFSDGSVERFVDRHPLLALGARRHYDRRSQARAFVRVCRCITPSASDQTIRGATRVALGAFWPAVRRPAGAERQIRLHGAKLTGSKPP
jgi:hypothetical protein